MSGSKLSFSFAKKIEKKSLQPSAIGNDQPEAPKNITQVIESIDENIIRTNEKEEEAKELVIPLVTVDRSLLFKKLAEKRELEEKEKQKNELEEDSTERESSGASEDKKEEEVEKPLSLDEQAALEVIKESKRALEQLENTGSVRDGSLQIEVDKLGETSVEASESSVLDYEKINIESFGAAMLRGMGWKKTGGVGTKRKVVEVVDPDKKGLSLSMNHMERSVTQAPDEDLELKPSAHVVVLSGRNKGVYGTVQTVDEDHILIRPARNSSNILREVEFNVRVVSKEEFKDSGRVINKEMYDEYKRKDTESKRRKASSSSSSDDGSSSEDNSKASKEVDFKIKDEPHKSEKVKDEKVKTEIVRDKEDEVKMLKDKIKKHNRTEVERPHSPLAIKKENSLDRMNERKGSSENVKRDSKKYDRERNKEYSKNSQMERDREYSKSSHSERDRNYSKSSNSDHSRVKGKYTSDKQDKYEKDRREEKCADKKRDNYSDMKSKRKYEEEKASETKYSSKDQKSRHKEEKYLKDRYKEKHVKEREEKPKKSKLEDEPVVVPWVRENLRVRFINKTYKGGRYYKEKVVVLNVLTAENCECVTEDGKVLREVSPTWLETVIPKTQPRLVQVVQGKHKGLVGRILEQHKEQEKASIQIIDDETVILKLHYDDICEIVN